MRYGEEKLKRKEMEEGEKDKRQEKKVMEKERWCHFFSFFFLNEGLQNLSSTNSTQWFPKLFIK